MLTFTELMAHVGLVDEETRLMLRQLYGIKERAEKRYGHWKSIQRLAGHANTPAVEMTQLAHILGYVPDVEALPYGLTEMENEASIYGPLEKGLTNG